jgi:hypothetical protein
MGDLIISVRLISNKSETVVSRCNIQSTALLGIPLLPESKRCVTPENDFRGPMYGTTLPSCTLSTAGT